MILSCVQSCALNHAAIALPYAGISFTVGRMMIVIPLPALAAGFLSAILYYCLGQGWITGVTAPYLPVMPLILAGTCYGRSGVMTACGLCAALLLILLPLYDALLTTLMQLVPVTIFVRGLMIVSFEPGDPPRLKWTSVGQAMSMLSMYCAMFFAFIIGTDNTAYHNAREAMIQSVETVFSQMDPEMAVLMETIVKQIPHILMVMEIWVWCIGIYAVTLFAQMVAESLGMRRRPDIRIQRFTPANLVLGLLAISGMAGFATKPEIMHAGQAAGMMLLFPYFFSGLGYVHDYLHSLTHGRMWVAAFYIIGIFSGMALLILVALTLFGLMLHLGRYSLLLPPRSKS